MAQSLREEQFGPFFGTPCGILAPLYTELVLRDGLTTIVREDNAVGIAAGAALAGRAATVLMQNSGFAQSVNALASLVVPYRISILLIISLRGTDADGTEENAVMGGVSELLLRAIGIPYRKLSGDFQVDTKWASRCLRDDGGPAALLVPPGLFGWSP
jgi:sulfopyruvate decarboxylase subunit alpha/phosphonopyruvate decarboxylase